MDAINDDRGKCCSHQEGQPAPTSVNICNIKMSNITFNNGGSFTIAFNQGKRPAVATETAADEDDRDGAADAAPPGKKAAVNSSKRKNNLSNVNSAPGVDAPGELPVVRVPFINEGEETRQMTMKRARLNRLSKHHHCRGDKQGKEQQFCQACLSNQCQ